MFDPGSVIASRAYEPGYPGMTPTAQTGQCNQDIRGVLLALRRMCGKKWKAFFLIMLQGQILLSASPQPVWDVRSFLAEPPRACHVRFTVRAERVGGTKPAAPKSEMVLAEGAWDGDSFYVKLNRKFPQIAGRDTAGTLWFADTDPAKQFVLRVHELDQTRHRSIAGVHAQGLKSFLDSVKTLGIHVLKPGTLRWSDTTHFEGELRELPPELNTGRRVSGEVTEMNKDGRIAKINYTWEGIPEGASCWVEYFYNQPLGQTLLPDTIVKVSEFRRLGRLGTTRHTNLLSHLKMEEGGLKAAGYQPEEFVSTSSTSKVHTLVWSNGITYETSSGKMNAIDPAKSAMFIEKRRGSRRIVIIVSLVLAGVVFAAGLAWRMWRWRKLAQ